MLPAPISHFDGVSAAPDTHMAAPIGSIIHYANKVVNLTALELVFVQNGASPTQTCSLAANSEIAFSWGIQMANTKTSLTKGVNGKHSHSLRFRLADNLYWSDPVELRLRSEPFWLALGPPDNYMLLLLQFEAIGMRRTLTLTASHSVVNRLEIPILLRLDSRTEGRAATGVSHAVGGRTSRSRTLLLPAKGSATPLVLTYSRHSLRSHSVSVCRMVQPREGSDQEALDEAINVISTSLQARKRRVSCVGDVCRALLGPFAWVG